MDTLFLCTYVWGILINSLNLDWILESAIVNSLDMNQNRCHSDIFELTLI